MLKAIRFYVRAVDRLNRALGRFAMLLVFAMMVILLYSAVSKAIGGAPIWIVEMAQFTLAAYYLLGGGYSIQLDSHVRMDLLYSRWTPKRRAQVDAVTVLFLIFYLVMLLLGGISSTEYAIDYNQVNYSSWAPRLWPIKVIMTFGILLILLQAVASFFRDLYAARGIEL
ncbi:MAG TPA: TRAP transporter small permease subunit [Kiloniellales bacterium]|nr:TRAP transporter small permease subunit [Kiloniellales bacterium]